MTLLQDIALETFQTFFVASPYLLLGLLMAGLLHVLVPESFIIRWMGRPGVSGVARAALIGVPLPVCSCGVVPITVEMRRKGASQPASLSFLITTPESSVDSIFFTWGLMGPVMAIARPIAAFFTAMLGGSLAIAAVDDKELDSLHHHEHHDCEAVGCSLVHGSTRGFQALRRLIPGLGTAGTGAATPGDPTSPPPTVWQDVARPALRYGFTELLDDLAFWLLVGIGAAGVLAALLPEDLAGRGLGAGILPMILVLAVAVPLYMCASASTPIAATLMAKGISPGAALVFLLAGPATNVATIFLLVKTFGRRFVQVYLASVIVGALLAGLALDALAASLFARGAVALPETSGEPGLWGWGFFVVMLLLLVWRLWKGAFRLGVAELKRSFGGPWTRRLASPGSSEEQR